MCLDGLGRGEGASLAMLRVYHNLRYSGGRGKFGTCDTHLFRIFWAHNSHTAERKDSQGPPSELVNSSGP